MMIYLLILSRDCHWGKKIGGDGVVVWALVHHAWDIVGLFIGRWSCRMPEERNYDSRLFLSNGYQRAHNPKSGHWKTTCLSIVVVLVPMMVEKAKLVKRREKETQQK
jgi:hypothetical protein